MSTDELSNGNWLYQMYSYLEYTPIPGEKITCMVEHASLKKPKLYNWGKRGYTWTGEVKKKIKLQEKQSFISVGNEHSTLLKYCFQILLLYLPTT